VSAEDDARWLETGRLAELGLRSSELVHELRQPLFAVKALAQLLERDLDGPAHARLRSLLDQVRHLERLVDRHADATRRPDAALRPVDLGSAVTAGVDVLRHRARAHDKTLALHLSRSRYAVLADPVAIQQITTNLVTNAIDAARSEVRVEVDGGVLEVHDDGPGIPDAVRTRIFEPFFSTKPPGRGTGLGLAITAQLVRASSGELDCRTSARGTVFAVRFAEAARQAEAG
jgi:Signal transduction histidine kinase regulating C4-dicarboxylate transport system